MNSEHFINMSETYDCVVIATLMIDMSGRNNTKFSTKINIYYIIN